MRQTASHFTAATRLAIFLIAVSTLSAQTLDPVQRASVGIKVVRPEIGDEKGSGYVISADNEAVYILTARHLFYAGTDVFKENIKVTFALDPLNDYQAALLVDFSNLDLAVLKLITRNLPASLSRSLIALPPVKVRLDSEPLRLREDIFLLGGKFQDWQLPKDTVSGLQDGTDRLDRFRFTGTGTRSGFSGSAIVDANNRLIGVHLGAVEGEESYGRAQRILGAASVLYANHVPMHRLDFRAATTETETTAEPSSRPSAACLRRPAGLVAWWPGDGSANDIVGGNNPSSLSDVVFPKGNVAQGFAFGQHGYIAIPNSLALASQHFTWSAWVRPDGAGPNNDKWGNVIVLQSIDNGHYFGLAWSALNSRFSFAFGSMENDIIFSRDAFPTANFYLIAATFDGNVVRLFVNGVAEGERRYARPIPYSSKSWMIGGSTVFPGWPRTWNGIIDEVQMFNRALSENELRTIYRAGSAGQCKSL